MPIEAKRPITDSGHGKQPDYSIPGAAAKHYGEAVQHYEKAARHHREASKYYQSGQQEKAGRHTNLAFAHHLRAEHHLAEATKTYVKNDCSNFYKVAKETHNESRRIQTLS